ncbi:TetR/AcrR family transcriptional regulator [Arthrobacter antioxidans]|uniref:TetR/AcrR family transcriptional regulator n=1 Tax=Arthrobacter antioxidans TaxID=2895818 RepID=UPI00200003F6|nr:TetR/AcrR family transcriptional regulator [Arthrobacter antioxidans]
MQGEELLRVTGDDGERTDAARNRRLILDAAAEIVATCGPERLTTDAVARRAGVGKGTVFRRFGNRAGLMHALADEAGRSFQHAFMAGPPPLGPGAPPLERLIAFGEASIERMRFDGQILRAAEQQGGPDLEHPTQQLTRLHLSVLLRGLHVQDPELGAYQLSAFLNAGLLLHLQEHRGMSNARLAASWRALVSALAADAARPRAGGGPL